MATGLRPASSNFVRILPMTPDCRASGFRMLRVRSTAMSAPVRGGACSRLEPQGQGAEEQLEVLVVEVEAGADEVVAAADDARPVDGVVLAAVHQVVRPHRQEEVIEKTVVGIELDARMVLERIGKFEGVGGNDQLVVEQVQLDAESARALENSEAPAERTVPFREVRAELECALGGRLQVVARK